MTLTRELKLLLSGAVIATIITVLAFGHESARAYKKGYKVGQIDAYCGNQHYKPKKTVTTWERK